MRRDFGLSRYWTWLTTVLVAVLVAGGTASAGKIPDIQVGLVSDDNVGKSEKAAEIRSDTTAEIALSWSRRFDVATGSSVSLTGTLDGAKFDEFDGLDRVSLGVSTAFRRKFGLGPTAPWFRGSLMAQYEDYDVDVRDGVVYTVEALGGKLLGERWDLSGGLSFESRRAAHVTLVDVSDIILPEPEPGQGEVDLNKPGDSFDLDRLSASLVADLTVNERLLLSFGVSFRDGEVASTGIPDANIMNASQAITYDPVFGNNYFAYKVDAEILGLAVDLNVALTADASLQIGIEHLATSAVSNIDYDRNIIRANYMRSF